MIKRFFAIIFVAFVCVGCGLRKNATDTYRATKTETHDTVYQVREVFRVDSVFIYHGKSRDTRNDTVFLFDTIRETRWQFLTLSDTTRRSAETLKADTLKIEKTTTLYKTKNSGWAIFATVWFVFTLVIFIIVIIWKIWRHLRK